MRLLKVVVTGAGLFVDDTFSMDLYAADRVSGKDGPAYNHVYRLAEKGRHKTERVCETCHHSIYEEEKYDYSGEEGGRTALEAFLNKGKNKVRYASAIADRIVAIADKERTLPTCVKKLFEQLDTVLHIAEDEANG